MPYLRPRRHGVAQVLVEQHVPTSPSKYVACYVSFAGAAGSCGRCILWGLVSHWGHLNRYAPRYIPDTPVMHATAAICTV